MVEFAVNVLSVLQENQPVFVSTRDLNLLVKTVKDRGVATPIIDGKRSARYVVLGIFVKSIRGQRDQEITIIVHLKPSQRRIMLNYQVLIQEPNWIPVPDT